MADAVDFEIMTMMEITRDTEVQLRGVYHLYDPDDTPDSCWFWSVVKDHTISSFVVLNQVLFDDQVLLK